MAGISVNSASAAAENALLRSAESDTAKAAILLKKVVQADKDLVNTLLPSQNQQLDIKA